MYCGLWSSNAHYWKASNSLEIVFSGAGVFPMFGTIAFPFKRIGSVSKAECISVSFGIQYWCSQTETTIQYEPIACKFSVCRYVLVLLTSSAVGNLIF